MVATDRGVERAVILLNRIPGVATVASCEGCGRQRARRHAEFAYVRFRHPLPPGLQAHLLSRIGDCARVEENAVYSRRPDWNQQFLKDLTAAAQAYCRHRGRQRRDQYRLPVTRVARTLVRPSAAAGLIVCLHCKVFVTRPHRDHLCLQWERIDDSGRDQWFAQFITTEPNQLPADLLAVEPIAKLRSRAERGQFGKQFADRWRVFVRAATTRAAIDGARAAVQRARQTRRWGGLDVYLHRGALVFDWPLPHRQRHSRG